MDITEEELKILYDRNASLIVQNQKLKQENKELHQRIHDIYLGIRDSKVMTDMAFDKLSTHFNFDDIEEDY